MSADDPSDEENASDDEPVETESDDGDATADVRDRIEEGADRAAKQIDESVVDLLAWILDTETRARIYVELRQRPDSTSEEIADGTGLYPSTVREALAELHEEGKLERRKRESDGAGNNPFEYRAMAPTDLVRDVVGDVQEELNTVFNLDRYLGGEERDQGPVRINVEETETGDDVGTSETEAIDVEDADSEGTAGDQTNEDPTPSDGSETEMVDATDGEADADEAASNDDDEANAPDADEE